MVQDEVQRITDLKGGTASFNDIPEVKKARDDFQYICSKTHIFAINNVHLMSMTRNGTKIGDALPVPFDIYHKKVQIPGALVNLDDPRFYVAVVCYEGGAPFDVLMLNSSMFQKKLLGAKFIKVDKKTNNYVLKIKNVRQESMQKYTFGAVMAQHM